MFRVKGNTELINRKKWVDSALSSLRLTALFYLFSFFNSEDQNNNRMINIVYLTFFIFLIRFITSKNRIWQIEDRAANLFISLVVGLIWVNLYFLSQFLLRPSFLRGLPELRVSLKHFDFESQYKVLNK